MQSGGMEGAGEEDGVLRSVAGRVSKQCVLSSLKSNFMISLHRAGRVRVRGHWYFPAKQIELKVSRETPGTCLQ